MNYASFHENENNLLETFLFASFEEIERTKHFTSSVFEHLELIITPECNQKCEYCYITKYGKDLFPMHRRADKETTLKHLKMVMDFFTYEKKFIFKEYELFAGDMYTTGYLIEVLEMLLPYFQYIMKKVPELPIHQETRIIIPTNLRFVENDEVVKRLYELVDDYTKINVIINFSWSHDGAYSTDLREKTELDDEYYKKAFDFVQKTGAGIHPMLCAAGAGRAIANFNWWVEMYEKYLPERVADNDYFPVFLEVRNGDEWTDEAIEEYLVYLKYRFEKIAERCENSIEQIAKYIFRHPEGSNGVQGCDIFDVIREGAGIAHGGRMSCTFHRSIVIRLSDLSIIPCHRLGYDGFIGGWFTTDEANEKIDGFSANNVSGLISSKMHRTDLAPVCANCWNRFACVGGCLGAQYEWSGELYLPIPSVCKLLKAKTSFLLKMLTDTKVLGYALSNDLIEDKIMRDRLVFMCERLGYDAYGINTTDDI